MKKSLTFVLMGLFAIGLVFAGSYVVSNLTFNVGVKEPFSVQYSMLGDAGNYDGTTECDDSGLTWFEAGEESIPTGDIYPGESRKLCVKIDNAGEGDIDYTISSEVMQGLGNYADCSIAFPQLDIYGTAFGSTETIDGKEFTIPGNAPNVTGCEVTVSVARG